MAEMRCTARLLFLALALAPSCATRPRAPGEGSAAPPPRIKDSAPEKRAALRNSDRNIGAEAEEQRWGIEAAQQREAQQAEKKRQGATPTPPPAPPTGPFDIRAAPKRPTGTTP